jgi:hypothetical protein
MTVKDGPGPWAKFFGHKVTKSIIFLAVVGAGSYGLWNYAQTSHDGIVTGFEKPKSLLVELDKEKAQKIFSPSVDDLQPKPFYILICDGNDMFCQKQLTEDEKVAKLVGDTVSFYHLDPNKQTVVYNAVHKAMESAAGQHIPQAFPLHTIWKTAFKFDGTEPTAGPALANMGEDALPAGGLLQWITKSLTPKPAAAPSGDDSPDGNQPAAAPAAKTDATKAAPGTDTDNPGAKAPEVAPKPAPASKG